MRDLHIKDCIWKLVCMRCETRACLYETGAAVSVSNAVPVCMV